MRRIIGSLIRMRRTIRSPIRIGRRTILVVWMRRRLMYRRRGLRRPVGVRILRGAESGQRDTRRERENFHTGLEFPAPHFLFALRLSLFLLLTSAAAAANRKRLPIAQATANPSAAQNSAARRDLPAPAN